MVYVCMHSLTQFKCILDTGMETTQMKMPFRAMPSLRWTNRHRLAPISLTTSWDSKTHRISRNPDFDDHYSRVLPQLVLTPFLKFSTFKPIYMVFDSQSFKSRSIRRIGNHIGMLHLYTARSPCPSCTAWTRMRIWVLSFNGWIQELLTLRPCFRPGSGCQMVSWFS